MVVLISQILFSFTTEKKNDSTILHNSLVEMELNQIWQLMTNVLFLYGKGEGDKA